MVNEIGVMFAAQEDLGAVIEPYRELRIRHGQMAITGELDLKGAAARWSSTLQNANFRIHTLFGVYTGESYADIPTVRRTVGFLPPETRQEREARTLAIVELAAELGVPGIATHIGVLPEDTRDSDYLAIREMVRRIADAAGRHNITFALETGQESADQLLDFVLDANRENLGVNFDPANMILYGTGDPIEALDTVGQHVLTVHCKDGDWPDTKNSGALGSEKPIGKGKVDFHAFLTMCRKIGYDRPLFIERESDDQAQRLRDIEQAKSYLERVATEVNRS